MVIAVSLKCTVERNKQLKLVNSNVNQFIYIIRAFWDGFPEKFIYMFVPKIVELMNVCFMIAAVLLLCRSHSMIFFAGTGLFIQLFFVNNILFNQGSKYYMIASAYVGIFGGFLYLNE